MQDRALEKIALDITGEDGLCFAIDRNIDQVRAACLGNGELKAKLTFKVNAVSEKAKAAIEGAGGTIEILK